MLSKRRKNIDQSFRMSISSSGSDVNWGDITIKDLHMHSDVQRAFAGSLSHRISESDPTVLEMVWQASDQYYYGAHRIVGTIELSGAVARFDIPALEVVATSAEADPSTDPITLEGDINLEDLEATVVLAGPGPRGPKGDKGDKGDKGATGPQGPQGPAGSDASVTSENIEAALGYTPANSTVVTSLSSQFTNLQTKDAEQDGKLAELDEIKDMLDDDDVETEERLSVWIAVNRNKGYVEKNGKIVSYDTWFFTNPYLLRRGHTIKGAINALGYPVISITDKEQVAVGDTVQVLISGDSAFEYTAEKDTLIVISGAYTTSPILDVSVTKPIIPRLEAVEHRLGEKQNTLVSGTNIKTINGESILGSGNLNIEGGGTPTRKTITDLNGGHEELLYKFKSLKKAASLSYPASTIKPCNILFTSDCHADSSGKRYLERIYSFYTEFSTYIDALLHGGDSVVDRFVEDNPFASFDGGKYFLNTIGNHDNWDANHQAGSTDRVTSKQVYDKFLAPFISNWGVIQPSGASNGLNYYYKDFTDNKVRLVVLDCMYWNDSQASWLTSVLADATTKGLHTIICNHYPISTKSLTGIRSCTFNSLGSDYGTQRLASDAVAIVKNAKASGLKFVCWLHGHCHFDTFGYVDDSEDMFALGVDKTTPVTSGYERDGIRYGIEYGEAYGNNRSVDAFDIINIDTTLGVCSVIRIGANVDERLRAKNAMTFDYINNKLLSNY